MVKSSSLESLPFGIEDPTKSGEDVTRSSNGLNETPRKLSSRGLSKCCSPSAVVRVTWSVPSSVARPELLQHL